jgi:TolA-binding protein
MEFNMVLGILQVVMLIVMGLLAWLRMPHQNLTETASSVKDLSDALDSALNRQKELEREQTKLKGEIKELNDILKEKNYSVTMVFQLGDQPIVKSVIIQPILVEKVK